MFTNVPEYSLVDDLSGEPLPSPLGTLAKREEVTEMYRREVWRGKSIKDCFRDAEKPHPGEMGNHEQRECPAS